ncbi:zinc ribbon domain-containing protein [Levilactobacillus humaensis]|uniref:zinc ribbon domain-containing protein n=1 Tax=Levilactobacillus humaensis TaxID=2950375 RepID=UPI0021C48671|nr:zinc ribbon domain-containing protein [Levilactobacillus humaensis]
MADSRIFKLTDGLDLEKVGQAIQNWLREKKQLHAEGMHTNEGYLVQAKQEDSWKTIVGMDSAIQVQIFNAGENQIMVNVGSGKWIDKAGAATIGMIAFAPLAVTAAIGAWNQKKLPEELFAYVEQFIMSGGKSVTVSMAASQGAHEGEVICPNCHAANKADAKFCASCGTKLGKECPNCHAAVGLDTKFCPNCGTDLNPKPEEKTCPDCQNVVSADTKFCPNCGHAFS